MTFWLGSLRNWGLRQAFFLAIVSLAGSLQTNAARFEGSYSGHIVSLFAPDQWEVVEGSAPGFVLGLRDPLNKNSLRVVGYEVDGTVSVEVFWEHYLEAYRRSASVRNDPRLVAGEVGSRPVWFAMVETSLRDDEGIGVDAVAMLMLVPCDGLNFVAMTATPSSLIDSQRSLLLKILRTLRVEPVDPVEQQ